jgi:hypothetical protein
MKSQESKKNLNLFSSRNHEQTYEPRVAISTSDTNNNVFRVTVTRWQLHDDSHVLFRMFTVLRQFADWCALFVTTQGGPFDASPPWQLGQYRPQESQGVRVRQRSPCVARAIMIFYLAKCFDVLFDALVLLMTNPAAAAAALGFPQFRPKTSRHLLNRKFETSTIKV